jgi:hypothetical protein
MYISKFVSVRPMTSRGGSELANQQILSDPAGETFVSYGTKIAYRSHKRYNNGEPRIVLDKDYWDYSRTTSKYRNEFLGFGIDECRRRISDGRIELLDLNPVYPNN